MRAKTKPTAAAAAAAPPAPAPLAWPEFIARDNPDPERLRRRRLVMIYYGALPDQDQRSAAGVLDKFEYVSLTQIILFTWNGLRDERAARPARVMALAKIGVELGCNLMREDPGRVALANLLGDEPGRTRRYPVFFDADWSADPLDSPLFRHPAALLDERGVAALVVHPRQMERAEAEPELRALATKGLVPWTTDSDRGAYWPMVHRTFVLARPDTPSLEPLGFWRFTPPWV